MAMSGRGGRRRRRGCCARVLRSARARRQVRPGQLLRSNPVTLTRGDPGIPDEGEDAVNGSVWDRIEESRARHNVLEHPFYVRWSAGELTREELARYAGQYRHATEALARLCHDAADEAPGEGR